MNTCTSDDPFWLPNSPGCPRALRPWLHHAGSLTRRIQQHCSQFEVKPQHCGLANIAHDEAHWLGIPEHQLAYSRSVFLYADQQPVVFAHSCCTRADLKYWPSLQGLGNQPLGALLFAKPAIQRSAISYRLLSRQDPRYQQAIQTLDTPPPQLWARRSLFFYQQRPLLVCEVFLPATQKLTASPFTA